MLFLWSADQRPRGLCGSASVHGAPHPAPSPVPGAALQTCQPFHEACLTFLILKVRKQVTRRIWLESGMCSETVASPPAHCCLTPDTAGHQKVRTRGDTQAPVSRRQPRAAGPGGWGARQPCPVEQPSAWHAGLRCLCKALSKCVSCSQLPGLSSRGLPQVPQDPSSPLEPCGAELFSPSPGNSQSNEDLVSLWRRASEPAGEAQMACRREARRLITASPAGWAGLAGRSHASAPVAVWPDPEASRGQES